MIPAAGPDASPAFEYLEPREIRAPVLFNSPHSGARYSHGFLSASRLDPLTLRRSEDAYVDELFMAAVEKGAPLMRAHFPRAYLDVNREPYELDPRMFEGRLPAFANTRSLRVAGGLGTIARVVGDSHEIYRGRLPVAEALARIDQLYKPYHAALAGGLAGIHSRLGVVLLVDCHSMPSVGNARGERFRADIVLGDRYGTSCAPEISACVEAELMRRGYVVARNRPYAGGFITENYGNPIMGFHALQIEINRGLYMDEATFARTAGFERVRRDLALMIEGLLNFPFESILTRQAAAE
jgi:N-formylglutamate deformylase